MEKVFRELKFSKKTILSPMPFKKSFHKKMKNLVLFT